MYSGLGDIYKVGQISEWQGKSNLSDFYSEGCQDLVGSEYPTVLQLVGVILLHGRDLKNAIETMEQIITCWP